ncbi:light-regulated signal transduction histidine kinase (bacteriophytochrome) [Paucimonas lemoignei]|uniref:histidine kinase n=1 Tax=Paucimonas lemoignei TaxID=29443 RepID=A0A4R3I3C2_PAULE|nr:ATP-binding protein [Paucimonas lemoignei]TCS39311.1 light-regulated signal transduction histidine kinase (bacteriophytochrome) [Paucimonas lemoignei]
MTTITTTKQSIDLSVCDREPISIPGSIQPHGLFVSVRADLQEVIQVSENVSEFVGKGAQECLGKDLAFLLGTGNAALVVETLRDTRIEARPVYLGMLTLESGKTVDALAHSIGDVINLEFELTSGQVHKDFRQLYPLIGTFLSKLHDFDEVGDICQVAANEVRKVTGFGRVLVYRFDEDGHGHVLAEALDEGYHSYLNQRFPASDVPKQARELYIANRIRLIGDANYVPSPLVPQTNPLTGKPADLTYSSLRSVSPIHVQYMKNMGTLASMSMSIVIKGQLWGLISCHNAEPKNVSYEFRTACEQLAQILALRIESKEEREEYNYRLELRRILVSMLRGVSQAENFFEGVKSVSPELLRFAGASGAALIFEGRMERFGDAPEVDEIEHLVEWLSRNVSDENVYFTNALAAQYPQAKAFAAKASGILAVPISRIHRHYFIWFRPEVVKTIDWAGNPHLKQASATAPTQLSPRASFAMWTETVRGTSLQWRTSEVEIASEFRTALLGIVLKRAEQMAELAEELGRANKELEAFSYSVSHDLRAPLRHIVGFSDLLLEFEGSQLSDRGKRFVSNITDAARFAGKLVDDLLSFSQMGRAALRISAIDMNEIVQTAIERLATDVGGRDIKWDIQRLPTIDGDPAFFQSAIYNLLANAVKYTRSREHAVITVRSEEGESEHIFHVSDNGVGFNMEYVHKLFGVFQRLHRMEDFEGTGIGLANVRRIVERHGGRVWAVGVPDQGATFSFAIPKQILVEGDEHAKAYSPR